MNVHDPSPADFPMAFAPQAELRAAHPDLADELFALTSRNADRLARWLPWVRATRTADDTRAFLSFARQQFTEGKQVHCVIFVGGRAAGVVGINKIDRIDLRCEFGYWIAEEFAGRGIVTEAVRALTDFAFTRLALHRCEVHCAEPNTRSARVAERAGYEFDALLKGAIRIYEPEQFVDRKIYRMLRSEWESRRERSRAGAPG